MVKKQLWKPLKYPQKCAIPLNSVKTTENKYKILNKFMAVPIYRNETWTMTKRDQNQTQTIEKKFFRSVGVILYWSKRGVG
jgi:hypothetical protein